jgi:hypothetical protein
MKSNLSPIPAFGAKPSQGGILPIRMWSGRVFVSIWEYEVPEAQLDLVYYGVCSRRSLG